MVRKANKNKQAKQNAQSAKASPAKAAPVEAKVPVPATREQPKQLSTYNKEKIDAFVAKISASLEASTLNNRSLSQRKATLAEKKAEREKRRAVHSEKAAELREKLKHDPEVDRRLESIREAAKAQRKEMRKQQKENILRLSQIKNGSPSFCSLRDQFLNKPPQKVVAAKES